MLPIVTPRGHFLEWATQKLESTCFVQTLAALRLNQRAQNGSTPPRHTNISPCHLLAEFNIIYIAQLYVNILALVTHACIPKKLKPSSHQQPAFGRFPETPWKCAFFLTRAHSTLQSTCCAISGNTTSLRTSQIDKTPHFRTIEGFWASFKNFNSRFTPPLLPRTRMQKHPHM